MTEPCGRPRATLDDGRTVDLSALEAAILQRPDRVETPSALESLVQILCETGAVFRYEALMVRKALDVLVEKGPFVRCDDATDRI